MKYVVLVYVSVLQLEWSEKKINSALQSFFHLRIGKFIIIYYHKTLWEMCYIEMYMLM